MQLAGRRALVARSPEPGGDDRRLGQSLHGGRRLRHEGGVGFALLLGLCLGWLGAGVHMAITQQTGRAAPIDLLGVNYYSPTVVAAEPGYLTRVTRFRALGHEFAVAVVAARRSRRAVEVAPFTRAASAEVAAAHAAFETRRTAAESYRREIGERAAELTSIAQLAYHEGERTILELLDVYRIARQGQLRAIEHEAAAKDAAIELERAVGEEVFP